MNSPATTLLPMTVKDILERSVKLYRSNLAKFIGIALLVKGPYLILETFLIRTIESSPIETSQISGTYFLLAKLLEPLFVVPILTAAMTVAVSEILLGRDIGITESYNRLLRDFFPLLGTILLSSIAIGLGFLILVVPGIVLWIWLAFIPQTVVIDGEGGISAIKRSKYLVKGYFGKTFILLILIFLAVSLVTGLISLGISRLFPFLGQYNIPLGTGVANVISVLIEPFKISAMIFLYYDFRIRKEGFDLEIMAAELEANLNDDYNI